MISSLTISIPDSACGPICVAISAMERSEQKVLFFSMRAMVVPTFPAPRIAIFVMTRFQLGEWGGLVSAGILGQRLHSVFRGSGIRPVSDSNH